MIMNLLLSFFVIVALHVHMSAAVSASTFSRIGRLQSTPTSSSSSSTAATISTSTSDFDTIINVNLRSDWPGSGIEVNVLPFADTTTTTGTTTIRVDYGPPSTSSSKYFVKVILDGTQYSSKEISSKAGYYLEISLPTTSSSSSTSSRNLQFLKQSEASCGDSIGVMEIINISISGGSFVSPSSSSTKMNMLFVGDSITAAYGVDGEMPCTFTAATENVFDGYAGIVTKHFNASAQFIAWSGKGVVRNYNGEHQVSTSPMPVYYNRTIAQESTDGGYYDPSQFPADIVYLMLGTNDYSTDPVPEDNIFIYGLTNLMNQITVDYPNSNLIVGCAPMQRGKQCLNIENAVMQFNNNNTNYNDNNKNKNNKLGSSKFASYLFLDPSLIDGNLGCDYHPNQAAANAIANEVIKKINQVLA